jgi:N-acetylmuramic acid 6-phosphate etherase
MPQMARQRSREFLAIAPQFQLGSLVTESFHPVTANLSEVAGQDAAEGLRLLFEVDQDVLRVYREFAASGRARVLAEEALSRLRAGGRLFFTGCGSTGRLSIQLDSIWRDHWRRAGVPGPFPHGCGASPDGPHPEVEPSHLKVEPSHPEAEPSHPEAEPSHLKAEPSHPEAEPSHLKAEPSHPEAEPSYLKVEPSHPEAEPSHLKAERSHPGAEPSHPEAEPSHPEVERSPASADGPHARAGVPGPVPHGCGASPGVMTGTVKPPRRWEDRTFSVMAGGDFALIKSVEGFEDFTQFGRRQIADLGVGPEDMVFAITEGGETSFVIGTAWQGVDACAKVVFVYNNPDEALRDTVRRSREVLDDPRIEKLNLTTGPMAVSGSTRMQATTIQQLVLLTVLEIVARELAGEDSDGVEARTLAGLEAALADLGSPEVLAPLAALVDLEAGVYRSGKRNNYFADALGIDVLTDTTERSPTYCTPPFRKYDDREAAESWAFLYVPQPDAPSAWRHILRREPRCVEWPEALVREMVPPEKAGRTVEVLRRIGEQELMRFRIGLDGIGDRPLGPGHAAVGVLGPGEGLDGFVGGQLAKARASGAAAGLISFGSAPAFEGVRVSVPLPEVDLRLGAVTRATVKMLLNALSTCTMVRLGRVMGNVMVWVVPSNLKLIDRSIRYVQRLTGLDYEPACDLVHEAIEYVEPRMSSDRTYPPVVELVVTRVREGLTNEEAEARLARR